MAKLSRLEERADLVVHPVAKALHALRELDRVGDNVSVAIASFQPAFVDV